MEENNAAHTRIYKTSDFLGIFALAIGVSVEYFLPFSISSHVMIRCIVSALLILLAWTILLLAKREFQKYAQPSKPNKSTTAIVETGIFARYRNPMYVGVVVLILATGILINSWWVIASAFAAALLMHYLLIVPEERYLTKLFGAEYLAYKAKTRRWV